MQSEFYRLVSQVERLERMHRSGIFYTGDVDELFALGRECRTALDADTARTQTPERPGPVSVFKPAPAAPAPEIATIAHEMGVAMESLLVVAFERLHAARVA